MLELIILTIIALVIIGMIPLIIYLVNTERDPVTGQRKSRPRLNYRDAESFGKSAEEYVSSYLQDIVNECGGYLFNDFCFEDDDGYSSKIDHILITRGGVFVIETKANKGTIYGDNNDDKWTCIKKSYQDDKILNNPIKQNKNHINHLRKMFVTNIPKMKSIIIFPCADISNIRNNVIYKTDDGMAYIRQTTKEERYSLDYVEQTYARFKDIQDKYGISHEKHMENINRIIES